MIPILKLAVVVATLYAIYTVVTSIVPSDLFLLPLPGIGR